MSEENEGLVRSYIDFRNRRDPSREGFSEFLAPDFIAHGPTDVPPGIDGQVAMAEELREAFPDMRIELKDVFSAGDKVFARWAFEGTHRGMYLDTPPTGNRVRIAGMTVWRVEGGRCLEEWGQLDQLGLLRQLSGAAPEAAAQAPMG